jgi:hypothetical protein
MIPTQILIPTIKPREHVQELIGAIEQTTQPPYQIHVSSSPESAAVNRNRCLDMADQRADILIMLDDDVSGFTSGWDLRLTAPFRHQDLPGVEQPHVRIAAVSARLMNADGTVAYNCGQPKDLEPVWLRVKPGPDSVMATAAVAFRNCGFRFDESFIGSGFEDGDYWFQYLKSDPGCVFLFANDCRLIHRNEMKGEQSTHFNRNRAYFHEKWGLSSVEK